MRILISSFGLGLGLAFSVTPAFANEEAAAARSQAATNMNHALNTMRTTQVPHLEGVLKERRLPRSVQTAPSRFLERGVGRVLKSRLELGLTADPATRGDENYANVTVNGNRGTKIESQLVISAQTGSAKNKVDKQNLQITSQTPATNRDPRFGIEASAADVKMWKTAGQPGNNGWVSGPGKQRMLKPISPGVAFRGESLPPGSHLVTVDSGPGMSIHFSSTNTPDQIANQTKSRNYLLKPDKDGNLRRFKLTAEETTHLQANTSMKSFTIKDGQVEDNHAPGHDDAALKRGNFTP